MNVKRKYKKRDFGLILYLKDVNMDYKKLLLKNYQRIISYVLPYTHVKMLFSSMIISHMPQIYIVAISKFREIIANNNK